MALGAQATQVFRLVVGQGLILTALGLGIGIGASLALTRLLARLLYRTTATDPMTFVAVALLLANVAPRSRSSTRTNRTSKNPAGRERKAAPIQARNTKPTRCQIFQLPLTEVFVSCATHRFSVWPNRNKTAFETEARVDEFEKQAGLNLRRSAWTRPTNGPSELA